ncbi:serine hydrolase domain-containing protein [Brachybacterium phenoliresistens]|uniref:serine hydrolase domain-containing protein n=1 Tax=Brachybacterium phenoliresistens TaxID=396014 RepID=UPI0031D26816
MIGRATPAAVGLDAEALARIPGILREGVEASPPRLAGASALVARHGRIVLECAEGWAVRWRDAEHELPMDQRVPAREDTIYDVASISKLFTAIAVLQLVEAEQVGLEDPVAQHLPRFAAHGKDRVRVHHLLTHTGGLPAERPLHRERPDPASRRELALETEPIAGPGERYVYSDIGMIALGCLVEEVAGLPLDAVVRARITGPLGMDETMHRPPAALLPRIAATEWDPDTGTMLRGVVHDEKARALDGVAGHAGIFSTASDLAVLAQTLLDGGRCGTARILSEESVAAMLTDRVAAITGPDGARRGLGTELSAASHGALARPRGTGARSTGPHSTGPWNVGSPAAGPRGAGSFAAGPRTAGHTGFTGTSLLIDPGTGVSVIVLANAVHPRRERSGMPEVRRAVADAVADALGTEDAPAPHLPSAPDRPSAAVSGSAPPPPRR